MTERLAIPNHIKDMCAGRTRDEITDAVRALDNALHEVNAAARALSDPNLFIAGRQSLTDRAAWLRVYASRMGEDQ